MNERISGGDFLAVMEETFSKGSSLHFTPSGSSMLPLLDGKNDTVTLSQRPPVIRKYDVIFYQRSNGALVLHRVVRCESDKTFILSGDNQYDLESGVRFDDVLAIMTAYSKNGKEKSVSDISYRLYSRFWVFKKNCRIFLSKLYHRIRKRA